MSVKAIVGAANQTAETGDTLGARFARELALVLRSLERRLRPIVVDAAQGDKTSIIRAATANRTRTDIQAALTDAGYNDLAESAYSKRLDALVAKVLETRRLAQQTARLSGAFDARIQAIKLLHETDLLDAGNEIARALWQATIRGVFNAQPVDRILTDLYDVIDLSEPRIQTLYDTSVSIFGRQVEALQAGDDPDTTFAYMGPADKKTRPFCREHVGKVYTRKDIDEMDNGQIDNVFLTGGGYNCRHTWVEVSKFSELHDLAGTGERIPEVAAQLQQAA
jgi:hypothetical protein